MHTVIDDTTCHRAKYTVRSWKFEYCHALKVRAGGNGTAGVTGNPIRAYSNPGGSVPLAKLIVKVQGFHTATNVLGLSKYHKICRLVT